VIGLLDEDGNIDIPRMRQVMSAAKGLAVTFHRAFDMCKDPLQAFETLGELGVARILTSGQQSSAEKGLQLITELKAHSGVPIIMAGAGVRASNLELFLNAGVKSCIAQQASGYRHPCVIAIQGCQCRRMLKRMSIHATV
jgi:copper homeostasis protein